MVSGKSRLALALRMDIGIKRIVDGNSYAPAESLWWPRASAIPYWRILYSKAL